VISVLKIIKVFIDSFYVCDEGKLLKGLQTQFC